MASMQVGACVCVCVFAHMRPGIFLGDFQDGWSRWVAGFGGKPWDDTGDVG